MNRIRALFEPGRTVFLPFMTAGLPDPAGSPDVFAAMAAAGADGFEVGIPYSDPLMDGPVISGGATPRWQRGPLWSGHSRSTAKVAARTGKPVLAMTYANPVMRMGPDEFCRRVAEAGGDGLVIPDLPLEESAATRDAAQRHGLGLVLFVAPTSDDARLQAVAAADPFHLRGGRSGGDRGADRSQLAMPPGWRSGFGR